MDNQHRKIDGYRELTQEEIDMINAIKGMQAQMGTLVKAMRENDHFDQRWVSIAQTHLQQGGMALVRAVAKPEGF